MTPDVRNQKQTIMRLRLQEACEAFQEGEYEAAAMRISQIHQMVSAYMGVDSDLYWYGLRLTILWAEFLIQDETRDFNAWAVGQACRVLKGLTSDDQGPLVPELAAENIQLAADYQDERPQLCGRGVVVLFKGQVAGWMNRRKLGQIYFRSISGVPKLTVVATYKDITSANISPITQNGFCA